MTSSCSFEFFLQSLRFAKAKNARHVKKLEISDVDLSHLDTRSLQEHFQASVMLRPESYGKLIFFFRRMSAIFQGGSHLADLFVPSK